MNLWVYGDETCVHDPTGKQPKSEVPALSSLIESNKYWETFPRKWIFDDFAAPNFHFKEFGPAACAQPDNPHHRWSLKKSRDLFTSRHF